MVSYKIWYLDNNKDKDKDIDKDMGKNKDIDKNDMKENKEYILKK